MKPVPFAVAQLAAIRETSVCNYTLTVCTPLLCDATAAAAGDPNSAARAGAGAGTGTEVAPGGVAPLTGAAGAWGLFFSCIPTCIHHRPYSNTHHPIHHHPPPTTKPNTQPSPPCCGCWSRWRTFASRATRGTGPTNSATSAASASSTTWRCGTPRVRFGGLGFWVGNRGKGVDRPFTVHMWIHRSHTSHTPNHSHRHRAGDLQGRERVRDRAGAPAVRGRLQGGGLPRAGRGALWCCVR